MATGDSLTPRQWSILTAATVLTAVSRVFAMARTPWDRDEVLFMQALRHFDVARHRPHPPGFPLYVLAGRAMASIGLGEFQALQTVSLIFAMAIVPAMFLLCRELGFRFSTALSAAVILAFMPNVWFYGGGAFSDVPSMTLVVVAVSLLLRGRRDARAYVIGAALLAIAAGVRPQNLLIGCLPFVMASIAQVRRGVGRVVLATSLIIVVVAASYGAAAWLTGWQAYRHTLRVHGQYIARTDSFRSPIRPPLWHVFGEFFVVPYRALMINTIVTFLEAIGGIAGLVKRRVPVLIAFGAFAPFCLFAWLVLDRFSASRFSIGYAPLVAILVAEGLRLVARRPALEVAGAAALVALMILWTWPALVVVRTTVAPTVAAVEWIRTHADPRTTTVYADPTMLAFAEWMLRDRAIHATDGPFSARLAGYALRENASSEPGAINFERAKGRLWDLARRRYFAASVVPVVQTIAFGQGWYPEEGEGDDVWRWMSARSVATLPPVDGDARLILGFDVPLDRLPSAPAITIRINGSAVDRFRPSSQFADRVLRVRARAGAPNELVIETDRVAAVPGDPRSLGLRLVSIRWGRATD